MNCERTVSGKARAVPCTLAVILVLCFPAARDASGGAPTNSWRDRAGACELVLEQYDGAYFHVRVSTAGAVHPGACTPTSAEFAGGLVRVLAAVAPDGVATLFLGTVSEVPGLAAELVAASRSSPGWDERLGRPRSGGPNGFVAGLLLRSVVLRDLLPGCEIVGVSVEKVLVPTLRAIRERRAGDGVPDGRFPYDAQIWVRLRTKTR